MLLRRLVDASAEVAGTRSRKAKIAKLAEVLGELRDDEVEVGASYLAGSPRQERLDVGWAALRDIDVPAADEPSLELLDVHEQLDALAGAGGKGSRQARVDTLTELLGRATAPEQRFLRGLVLGELRQGALEGVVVQAIAQASGVPLTAVRRALMLAGDLGAVTRAALSAGMDAVEAFRLELFRPVQPMLAQTSPTVEDAVGELGRVVVDAKLDGARVQIHRRGDDVRVYTRNLRDVTEHVPDVASAVRALDLEAAVFDGEAIALAPDGRPHAFQTTMSRFGRSSGMDELRDELPLSVFLFDCLHLDGTDLLDHPLEQRLEAMDTVVPADLRPGRAVTDDPGTAAGFFDEVLAAGHEGVMVKGLGAAYEAGRRGATWRKVKPVHTLDLVVLAAEWGSGRRKGWLSNLHLGARDPEADGYVMLGKTFKGLTDRMLAWQTERFLELETSRRGQVVHVRPEQVVEVAFDGVQRSSRYPAGVTLRFARVKGYRNDKDATQADTIGTVRAIHEGEIRPERPRPDG